MNNLKVLYPPVYQEIRGYLRGFLDILKRRGNIESDGAKIENYTAAIDYLSKKMIKHPWPPDGVSPVASCIHHIGVINEAPFPESFQKYKIHFAILLIEMFLKTYGGNVSRGHRSDLFKSSTEYLNEEISETMLEEVFREHIRPLPPFYG